MKEKKQFVVIFLLLLCIGMFYNPASAKAVYVTASGQAGDDAIWELDNEGTLTFSGSGSLYGAGITSGYSPWGRYSDYVVKKVVVKEGITNLGGHDLLSQCPYLESVTLPDGLESIGDSSFRDCPELKSVKIGKDVTYIGSSAFAGTPKLEALTLPESLVSVGKAVFMSSGIKSIVFPTSFNGSFEYDTAYNNIFSSCDKLESIVINGHVSLIDDYFVSRANNLKFIIFNCDAPQFGNKIFSNAPACTCIYPAGNKTFIGNMPSNGLVSWMPSTLDTMKIKSAKSVSSGIKLSWEPFTLVTGYNIYRQETGGSWKKIKTITDVDKDSFTDKSATKGVVLKYKVCAFIDVPGAYLENTDSPAKSVVYINGSKISKVINGGKGLTIKWAKNKDADGYYIYRKSGSGSWKEIKQITNKSTTSFKDNYANTNGTKYSYRIYTYKNVSGKTYKSTASATVTYYFLKAPVISSVTNKSSSKMNVKWNKNTKASGYQVEYATDKDFSSGKKITIKKNSTITKTISNLTKNKKYYVRVRSYKTVSEKKQYSAWSSISSLKK